MAYMKIQLMSDLHLEFTPMTGSATEADVVVLAGDIGNSVQGVAWAAQQFAGKSVVYVPGNHEYFHSEIGQENFLLQQAGMAYGVHVLNRSAVVIDGVRFLGCTLWTDFGLFGEGERPWAYSAAWQDMPDFHAISCGERLFAPSDAAEMHRQDVAWLRRQLFEQHFPGQTVVVTHHAPARTSVPRRYRDNLLSACFASRCEDLFGTAVLWVHGHIHDTLDYEQRGTRVVCNPRGYFRPGRAPENPDFRADWVVEI